MAKKSRKSGVKRLTHDEVWTIGEEWAKQIRSAGLRVAFIEAMDMYQEYGNTSSAFGVAEKAGLTLTVFDDRVEYYHTRYDEHAADFVRILGAAQNLLG